MTAVDYAAAKTGLRRFQTDPGAPGANTHPDCANTALSGWVFSFLGKYLATI